MGLSAEHERSFSAFVDARGDALLRTACLLTGDRHAGQDLLQLVLPPWPTRLCVVLNPSDLAQLADAERETASIWTQTAEVVVRQDRVVESRLPPGPRRTPATTTRAASLAAGPRRTPRSCRPRVLRSPGDLHRARPNERGRVTGRPGRPRHLGRGRRRGRSGRRGSGPQCRGGGRAGPAARPGRAAPLQALRRRSDRRLAARRPRHRARPRGPAARPRRPGHLHLARRPGLHPHRSGVPADGAPLRARRRPGRGGRRRRRRAAHWRHGHGVRAR